MKLLGIISVDFDAIGKLLIIDSAFVKYLKRNGNRLKQCISYLQTSRKPVIRLGNILPISENLQKLIMQIC
jgi:stalled ribosome rescue protein Dom34